MRAAYLVLVVALACGSEKPKVEPPPPPPGLSDAEADRLPRCIEALEKATDSRTAPALIAVGCAPQCALEIPASIAADEDELLAFVAGRCARDAGAGQKMWRLAEIGGAWIAEVYGRARNSHPHLAERLDDLFGEVQAPLHLEAEVDGLYDLPPAARPERPGTEVYVVVGAKSVRAGITGWASIGEDGPERKVGFGGPFPGRRVRLRELRQLATQLHATVSDNENATAYDRAPLLLADSGLSVARLRAIVRRLGRARLGVALRGLAGEHKTHLNWIDRWRGTWLLFRPGRAVIRATDQTIQVPHRDGRTDWAGVRAALSKIGGGDLAIDPPAEMTVRELTVVLDQIGASGVDPALFFSRRPRLEPTVAINRLEIAEGRLMEDEVLERLEALEPGLLACYKPFVKKGESTEGTAQISLEVDRRGRVADASVEATLGGAFPACLDATMRPATFPRPRPRRATRVTIQLGFAAN